MERCRFCNCMKLREFCENIFDNKQIDPTIPKIVELLTNLKIVENDPYTKFVCFNCFNILIIFYHYRERVLETNQLLLKNEINTNQKNVKDFHKNWPRIKQCDDGQFVIYNNDSDNTNLRIESKFDKKNQHSNISIDNDKETTTDVVNKKNCNNYQQFLKNGFFIKDEIDIEETCLKDENEFDGEEEETIGKNNQHSNISIDNDKETIIEGDNNINCNNDDDDDKNNQQLLKSNSSVEQPLDFLIKDELNIEETCLKIENNFNDEDQEIYENNHHRSYDDDDNDKTIININQISDKRDSDRYRSNIIENGSSNEEFPSIIGSDSEDEDNQPLSTLISVNKKIRNNINIDGNLHDNNSSNITTNQSNNDQLCSTIVTTSDKNPGVHKNNRFSNKPHDDAKNKTTSNNNNNSDKDNNNIIVLNEQLTGEKHYYQCFICKKNFSNDSNLTKHLLNHTRNKKCNICGKKFINNSYLAHHLLIHKGEKPHLCNICGKRFTQNNGLKYHLKAHTGEKSYQCDICNKKFTSNYALKSHLKIHTGEKSQQCYICNMRFLQRGPLKRHLKKHSREKPYQCRICDKKFTFKPVLERHLKVHSDEKSHQCNICDKRFTFKYSLKRHLKVHTG